MVQARIPFQMVLDIYNEADGAPVSNAEIYRSVAERSELGAEGFGRATAPVGKAGQVRNLAARSVRWHQQTARHLGLLEKGERRGTWSAVSRNKKGLTRLHEGKNLLGFSTRLGLAIWGDCRAVFAGIEEPIACCITSPPFPLAQPRDYGNPKDVDYIDFICRCLEPILRNLIPGGSLALELGNDIFIESSPARSLYQQRLVLALCDRFGLSWLDNLVWHNPSRPPGPIAWASKQRCQTNFAYSNILWLTNDPKRLRSDNRRVLEPHSAQQKALMAAGGEKRSASYANGAYKLREGRSFSNPTAGRIPKNILRFSHNDKTQAAYRRAATELGLPLHGAAMPVALASWLVRFLSEQEDILVDPFSGTCTLGRACEPLNRYWIAVEEVAEYLRGGAETLSHVDGYMLNPSFASYVLHGVGSPNLAS